MEWVETTGKSVQEAKESALDELGVDEIDAEFEVLAEAQTGLFGRLRSEARVRARVRPTAPRAKDDRRDRRGRRRSGTGDAPAGASTDVDTAPPSGPPAADAGGPGRTDPGRTDPDAADGGAADAPPATGRPRRSRETAGAAGSGRNRRPQDGGGSGPGERPEASGDDAAAAGGEVGSRQPNRNRQRGTNRPGSASPSGAERAYAEHLGSDDDTAKGTGVEVDLDSQAEVAVEFLEQLTAEFGLQATVTVAKPDEDTVELQLSGDDLGILIGPKGATLVAVQNLTRTVVFNETGGSNGHINVDVGGYRQKRTEALVRFAKQIAEQVRTSGNRTALEPMSALDRKIVHDTLSEIDGVSTVSEGEEPRRRVVVLPG
jgi:spoIIIJ-associated protein